MLQQAELGGLSRELDHLRAQNELLRSQMRRYQVLSHSFVDFSTISYFGYNLIYKSQMYIFALCMSIASMKSEEGTMREALVEVQQKNRLLTNQRTTALQAIRDELNKDWRLKLEQQKASAERELRFVSEQLKCELSQEANLQSETVRNLEEDLELARKTIAEGEEKVNFLKDEVVALQETVKRLENTLSMELTQAEEHLAFLALNEALEGFC
jgi:hypothetical protein